MFHEIILMGQVGQKPELRHTAGGEAILDFWVQCTREYKTGALKKEETQRFKISIWGGQATFFHPKIQSGAKLKIKGRLLCDPETGGPRMYLKSGGRSAAAFEVRASEITFIGTVKG